MHIPLFSSMSPNLKHWLLVVAFVLVGLALRWPLLDQSHLNSDEAWHLDLAGQNSLSEVISYNFAQSVHPPLYYLLLYELLRVTEKVGALRLVSVLPWMAWVFVCFGVGEKMGGGRMGLIWAAIAAFSHGTFELSLAVREYMWMLLLITAQFYYFLALYEQPTRRAWVGYLLCGVLALGFDYSAVPAIMVMGVFLIYRALFTLPVNWRACMKAGLAHLLLAALFILLYLQHGFHHLEHARWYNAYYFRDPLTTLLLFSFLLSNFFIPLQYSFSAVAVLPAMVLTLSACIYSLCRRFNRFPVRRFFFLSLLLMLVLNAMELYSSTFNMRLMSWMLPGIIAIVALGVNHLFTVVPPKRHSALAVLLITLFGGSSMMLFHVTNAATKADYQAFLRTADTIGANDLAVMDIQTMMILRPQSDWQIVANGAHLTEARWNGRRVLYPNWPKMDTIDTQTGKRTGGIALYAQPLAYFAQQLEQVHHHHDVWLLQLGHISDLGKECQEALEPHVYLRQASGGMIARFTAEDFAAFVDRCPV